MTAKTPTTLGLRQHGENKAAPAGALSPSRLLEDAFLFMAEEALVNVSLLAAKRSRTPGDYSRALGIAQAGLTFINELKLSPKALPLLGEVRREPNGLTAWAARLESPGTGAASLALSGLRFFLADGLQARGDYLADCFLATVEGLAFKKNPSMRELFRQAAVAQRWLDACVEAGVTPASSRAKEIMVKYRGSVTAWAQGMRRETAGA